MPLGIAFTTFQVATKFTVPITGFGTSAPYALSSDGTALSVDVVKVDREVIGYVMSGSLDTFRSTGTPTVALKDGANDATVSVTVQSGASVPALGIASGSFVAGAYSWLMLVGVTGTAPVAFADDGTALTTRLTNQGWIVGGFFESAGTKSITIFDKGVTATVSVQAITGGIPANALRFADGIPLQFSDGSYLELAA